MLAFISTSDFGLWLVLFSVAGVVSTFEVALGQNVTREVAKTKQTHPAETILHVKRIIPTIGRIYLLWAVGVLGVLLVITPFLKYLLEEAISAEKMLYLWLTCILGSSLYLYGSKSVAIIDGLEAVWVGRLSKLIYEAMGLVLLIALLYANLGLYALGLAFALQSLMYVVWNQLILSKCFLKVGQRDESSLFMKADVGAINIRPAISQVSGRVSLGTGFDGAGCGQSRGVDSALYRRLTRSIANLGLVHLGTMLVYLIPNLFIARFVNLATVTQYNIICQVLQISNVLLLPAYYFYFPRLAANSEARMGEYLILLKYTMLVAVITNSLVLLFIQDVVRIWVGEEYYIGSLVVAVLVFISILDLHYIGIRNVLVSANRTELLIKLVWVGCVVDIALTAVLGSTYGLLGIVVSPLIVEFVWLNLLLIRLAAKASSFDLSLYVNDLGALKGPLFVLLAVSSYLNLSGGGFGGVGTVIGQVIGAVSVLGAGYRAVRVEDRRRIIDSLGRLVFRGGARRRS